MQGVDDGRPQETAGSKGASSKSAKGQFAALVAARYGEERRARSRSRGVQAHQCKEIATSLKRSAEHSARRKSGAYRSALSMLTFYVNRAGKKLPRTERDRLERAKTELKRQFHRE